jgi:hypothetical protein
LASRLSILDAAERLSCGSANSQDAEASMKYVLLAYADEQQLDAMPSSEREALGKACLANDQALRTSGRLLAVESLQGSCTASTVRVHNGIVSITDRSYAETAEQLVGIFTIDARDLNEAIQVAAQMPQARAGAIEVRPIRALDQP